MSHKRAFAMTMAILCGVCLVAGNVQEEGAFAQKGAGELTHRRKPLQGAGAGAGAGHEVGAGAGTGEAKPSEADATKQPLQASPSSRETQPGAGAGAGGGAGAGSSQLPGAGVAAAGVTPEELEKASQAAAADPEVNQAAASLAAASSASGDDGSVHQEFMYQRQPEFFEGVTQEEWKHLRSIGEITAEGNWASVKETPAAEAPPVAAAPKGAQP